MTDAKQAAVDADGGANPRVGGFMQPAGFSWALFEFARNPYFMLVVTYIFAPYFAVGVVGNEAQGQAAVAEATKWAGIIGAITAPVLGAMMDRGGARKPLMAAFLAMIVVSGLSLWWAMPGRADANGVFQPSAEGLGIAGTMAFLVLGYVGYTYSELMHNAMLRTSGRPEALPMISGLGIGLGQLSAALLLIGVVVVALMIPVLGTYEGGMALPRAIGPIVAIWLVVFAVPFFLYTPDGHPPGGTWSGAARAIFSRDGKLDIVGSITGVFGYVRGLVKAFPETMKYLLACLIFKDGITALLAIGGTYATLVLNWEFAEMGLYGIWASIFGFIGGIWLVGVLDRRLGPRRAIIVQLSVMCAALLFGLGITQDSLLYGMIPAGQVVHPLGVFDRLSDVSFLLTIAIVAAFAAANQSAARYMIVLLAPKERMSEFFGLFAMSSTATVWLGPFLIEVFTKASNDTRIGFSPVLILLVAGLLLMLTLKKQPNETGREPAAQDH